MPAKPKTIATAERRQIRAEIKTLESNRRKVCKDFDAESKALRVAAEAAVKKLTSFNARRAKQEPRAVAKFDRSIAILKGRLGV